MRVAIVINAASGSMSADVTPPIIRAKLAAAGFELMPEPDNTAPLPARIEAAAAQPDIEALVVAGGDGTMACAAGVLDGRDLPLALLPLGTANLLAKDLGLPLDPDAAIAAIRNGGPTRIDVGEVNGQAFLITSVLGMPTRLAEHREAGREGFDLRAASRWSFGLLRHLGRYPRLTVTTAIDGTERQLRMRLLAVVNNDFAERAGEIMVREPLSGSAYPRTLLAAAIIRLRAGDDPGWGWHAAVSKACINRSTDRKEERLPVARDPNHQSQAYQLGRLFYVLEAAQRAALGQVNATIADRYYGAASSTPARVFGSLLRGLRNHVSDARKRGFGGWIEPRVAEIMSHLPPDLPKTLTLEDQGRFAVGYYHERGTRPVKEAEPQDNDAKGDEQ